MDADSPELKTFNSTCQHVAVPIVKIAFFFLNLQGPMCDLLKMFTFFIKNTSNVSTIQHIFNQVLCAVCLLVSGTHTQPPGGGITRPIRRNNNLQR